MGVVSSPSVIKMVWGDISVDQSVHEPHCVVSLSRPLYAGSTRVQRYKSISRRKHMLWVLKVYVEIDGENPVCM